MPISKQIPDGTNLPINQCWYLPVVSVSPDPAHHHSLTIVNCQYLAISVSEFCPNPTWGQGWEFNADNGYHTKVPPNSAIGPGPLNTTKGIHTGYIAYITAGTLDDATQLCCEYRVGCHGDGAVLTANVTVMVVP